MATPIRELPEPNYSLQSATRSLDEVDTFVAEGSSEKDRSPLHLKPTDGSEPYIHPLQSPSQSREQERRLDDDLAVLQAERVVSTQTAHTGPKLTRSATVTRSKSRHSEPVDEFDAATNPIHEKNAVYRPPENPSTNLAKAFKKIHNSSFLVRYFTYIVPVVALLLIPLLFGALLFKNAHVGGVQLMWFSVWLEILWLTLWAGRVSSQR